jgi:hypothetical protein
METMTMAWRVIENTTCRERCDRCRSDGSECDWRWCVIDDDCTGLDSLVAYGFSCREEAEAYVRYPEVR